MSFGQRLATSSIMLLGRLVRVIPRSVSSGKDGRNVRSASVKSAYPRSNLRSVGWPGLVVVAQCFITPASNIGSPVEDKPPKGVAFLEFFVSL